MPFFCIDKTENWSAVNVCLQANLLLSPGSDCHGLHNREICDHTEWAEPIPMRSVGMETSKLPVVVGVVLVVVGVVLAVVVVGVVEAVVDGVVVLVVVVVITKPSQIPLRVTVTESIRY